MAEIDDAEQFLTTKKEAVGTVSWTDGARPGILQIEWPLFRDGQSTGGRLIAKASTQANPGKFTLVVLYGKCLALLEHDALAVHLNPLRGPKGLIRGKIVGSHYHVLPDNRSLVENGTVPRDLKYARQLPSDLKDFPSCLKWFCNLNNIDIRDDQLPTNPQQPRLL